MRILIKLSGKVLESADLRTSLASQIRALVARGEKVILVHGAGRQLSEYCRQQGIPVVQHSGRRVTDEATLEAALKVFSHVNCEITASLLATGVSAIGLRAFDGGLTECRKRPPIQAGREKEEVDFGLVAEITRVSPQTIEAFWEISLVPVVASLCADAEGQILNINADTLGAELAVSLQADLLVGVSDVEGLYLDLDDPRSLIRSLTREEAGRYLEDNVFRDGMLPKIQSAISLLERGVSSYLLVSGIRPGSILNAIDGNEGTLFTR